MSAEWEQPEGDWQPPTDPEEYAEWVEKFPGGIVDFGLAEGLTHAQLEWLRRAREGYRADRFAAAERLVAELRARLRQQCPEVRWPKVFTEGFARAMITEEPLRTAMLEHLEKWIVAIERAYGGEVRPVVTWKHIEGGIDVDATIPKPCDMVEIYYRIKGRAQWKFLVRNTSTLKRLYTTAEYLDEPEKKLWPGRTLEFVAVGWFEEAMFGFPTEPVAVPVPALAVPPLA